MCQSVFQYRLWLHEKRRVLDQTMQSQPLSAYIGAMKSGVHGDGYSTVCQLASGYRASKVERRATSMQTLPTSWNSYLTLFQNRQLVSSWY